MWLFSLEKRGLQGDLIAAFQSLRGVYNRAEDGLFIRDRTDRTSGNGFTLKLGRFRLDARKKFFTRKVEQVSQRSCGYPISGIQAQAGQAFEQYLCMNLTQTQRLD